MANNVHARAVFYEMLDEFMTVLEEKIDVFSTLKEQYKRQADDLITEHNREDEYKDAVSNVKYYNDRERACMEIYDRLQNIYGG